MIGSDALFIAEGGAVPIGIASDDADRQTCVDSSIARFWDDLEAMGSD